MTHDEIDKLEAGQGERMKYLFIGGSRDGQRWEVSEDQNLIRVPKMSSILRAAQEFCDDKPPATYEHELYLQHILRGGERLFRVFVIADYTDDDVIDALIAGYRG